MENFLLSREMSYIVKAHEHFYQKNIHNQFNIIQRGDQLMSKTFSNLFLRVSGRAIFLFIFCFALTGIASAQTTFTNATSISIPNSGSATPYPSAISVSGLPTSITKVTVSLNNYSHTFPDDVDMMLVAPNGTRMVISSDVCGNAPIANLNIVLDDAAANITPDAGTCVSTTYRPSNVGTADPFPAPASTSVAAENAAPAGTATFASRFNGIDPNGTWNLFVVDDTTGDAGTLAGGWSITISAGFIFTNPAAITINSTATPPTPASPYPSNITASGIGNFVSKITVRLNGYSHTFPDDVDMMLVAPTGERIVFNSDTCGTATITNLNLTFDDDAAAIIPDNGTCVTNSTYRPSNVGTADPFAAPAPAPVYPADSAAPAGTATFASKFGGINPNGTWSLYIVDDADGDAGTISGGWTLTITPLTTTSAPASITGRVSDANGRGISGAQVKIVDTITSETKFVSTNPFGFYQFSDLSIDSAYIVTVMHKRYTFINNPRIVQLFDDTDIQFIAETP